MQPGTRSFYSAVGISPERRVRYGRNSMSHSILSHSYVLTFLMTFRTTEGLRRPLNRYMLTFRHQTAAVHRYYVLWKLSSTILRLHKIDPIRFSAAHLRRASMCPLPPKTGPSTGLAGHSIRQATRNSGIFERAESTHRIGKTSIGNSNAPPPPGPPPPESNQNYPDQMADARAKDSSPDVEYVDCAFPYGTAEGGRDGECELYSTVHTCDPPTLWSRAFQLMPVDGADCRKGGEG
ncbi:hypothetical protein BZA05DRAFT_143714 [Tricharina praecox]|uniref:uncharacterized protein n=1 Tax=Tricharina praecox TaxID=43433 RepID=UPI00221E8C1B|nr:uncharacterized protein BZA05DRAFT_143714 [Tricharina praecox]KAI5845967.1 hypothetical protein BZA05DRAFT_143714 [Tricharina praecox]